MKRVIKFRIYGQLWWANDDGVNEMRGYFVYNPRDKRVYELGNKTTEHCCQFTGLLDKNGIEIYEGDVIRVNYGGDDEIRSVAYWGDDGYPAFDLSDNDTESNALSTAFNEADIFEVIGNIYQNPELLK